MLLSFLNRPDTQGFLNKLEEEKRKKEIEAKEPQSFFGKYVSCFLRLAALETVKNLSNVNFSLLLVI